MKILDRKHRLNIILTFVIPGVILYAGLVVTFFLLNLTFSPGQIVMAYLPEGPINPIMMEQMIVQLGLNQPLFFRFLKYIGDFLTGNWGVSFSIARGMPVTELVTLKVPRSFELLILPICIGVGLGYLFGRVSNRSKRNWLKNLIQLISGLFLAVPIFIFGMFLQYTLGYLIRIDNVGIFPTTGFKTIIFEDPPFVTGFRILDSLISGQWHLAADTLYHYALPMIILTVAITALMTRFYSSKMVKDSYKNKSILSRTAKTSAGFGLILTYSILVETTFGLAGFGQLLIDALANHDFYTIQGILFFILILLAFTILVSNLVFSLHRLRKDKLPPAELVEPKEREVGLSGKEDVKNYLKKIVKSPLIIIGIIAVLILIIISIFPELISGMSLAEAQGIYMDAWNPPSPDHPLGQGKFGRDILALVVYGTRGTLAIGLGAVLIGLIGGLIFGLLASKFRRKIHTITTSVMLIFYILPGIVLVMLFTMMVGQNLGIILLVTGLLLIPSFTRIIANTEFRVVPIIKKIIAYLPLFAGFAILLFVTLGFLGFSDPRIIELGDLISEGRAFLYIAPWASLWPGFTIFLILISLFVLHEGLAKHSR